MLPAIALSVARANTALTGNTELISFCVKFPLLKSPPTDQDGADQAR